MKVVDSRGFRVAVQYVPALAVGNPQSWLVSAELNESIHFWFPPQKPTVPGEKSKVWLVQVLP